MMIDMSTRNNKSRTTAAKSMPAAAPAEPIRRQKRHHVTMTLGAPVSPHEMGSDIHASAQSAIHQHFSGSRDEVALKLRELADFIVGTLGAPITGAHVVVMLFEAPVEVYDHAATVAGES